MGSGEEETTGSRTEGCPIVPAMLLMVMGSRLRSLLALTLSGLFFLSGSLPLDVRPAEAMTIETVDFHCPLCATHFRARLAGSGTATGTRLDLQGTGYIAQPWPQLRCPKCNLILFQLGRFAAAAESEIRPPRRAQEALDSPARMGRSCSSIMPAGALGLLQSRRLQCPCAE